LHFRITYQPSNLFVLIQIQTKITKIFCCIAGRTLYQKKCSFLLS
jgi:hypothetical protein